MLREGWCLPSGLHALERSPSGMHRPFEPTRGSRTTVRPVGVLARFLAMALLVGASLLSSANLLGASASPLRSAGTSAAPLAAPVANAPLDDSGPTECQAAEGPSLAAATVAEATEPLEWALAWRQELAVTAPHTKAAESRRPGRFVVSSHRPAKPPRAPPFATPPVD